MQVRVGGRRIERHGSGAQSRICPCLERLPRQKRGISAPGSHDPKQPPPPRAGPMLMGSMTRLAPSPMGERRRGVAAI